MKNDRVFYTGNAPRFFLSAVQQMRFTFPHIFLSPGDPCIFHPLALGGARQCFIYTRFSTYKRFHPFDHLHIEYVHYTPSPVCGITEDRSSALHGRPSLISCRVHVLYRTIVATRAASELLSKTSTLATFTAFRVKIYVYF